MNLVSFALRRPISLLTMVVAVALVGLLALDRMSRDIFPDLGVPVLYVAQPYGGLDRVPRYELEAEPVVDHGERAAVLLGDDVRADRQAEPGAFAGGLGYNERLEQFVALPLGGRVEAIAE